MSELWERGEHPAQAEVHEPVEPEDMLQRSTIYEWLIVMHHERNAFRKTFHPEAARLAEALQDADMQLADSGYNPVEFDCIEAKRGRVVGR